MGAAVCRKPHDHSVSMDELLVKVQPWKLEMEKKNEGKNSDVSHSSGRA